MNFTPAQRIKAALELKEPLPGLVPHFELGVNILDLILGDHLYMPEELEAEVSKKRRERMVLHNAELGLRFARRYELGIIAPIWATEDTLDVFIRYVRQEAGEDFLLWSGTDGTFGIPSGETMLGFVYKLEDDPEGMRAEAEKRMQQAIDHNKRLVDRGIDVIVMGSDYCLNTGPFLSPSIFREFVKPYLHRSIAELKAYGAYVIKHTDGNIMPILDQLIECAPHAIHSLDPQAGVDLAEAKRMCQGKVALCGNVKCALLQSGTAEEVFEDARRALREGMPGGGYVFCSSNTIFGEIPPENYLAMLEARSLYGRYSG